MHLLMTGYSEGNRPETGDQDCNGDCFGTAFLMHEFVPEGNTGHEYNSDQIVMVIVLVMHF